MKREDCHTSDEIAGLRRVRQNVEVLTGVQFNRQRYAPIPPLTDSHSMGPWAADSI